MLDFIQHMTWWHWLILAVVLVATEVLVPGAVAIWFAVGAGIVGVLLLAFGALPWIGQWLLFAAIGVIATVGYRKFYRKDTGPEDAGNLNQRGVQHIGKTYVLIEAIVQGRGKAQVGDGSWIVNGPDTPNGARVRVVGVEGTVLHVEPSQH